VHYPYAAPRKSSAGTNPPSFWEKCKTASSTGWIHPPSFQKGQTVELYYDPQNPKEAVIDTFWELWFTNVLLTGLSLPFLGVGLALAWNW
jgi:hypothetical protein